MRVRSELLWLPLVALAGLTAGCGKKPRAPALQDEPVYENPQEGFRFVAPEGWRMRSRSEVPPGPLKQERLLVEYRRSLGELTATLFVAMADVSETDDLAAHVGDRAARSKSGRPSGGTESLEVGGLPALRSAFESKVGRDTVLTEVVAVRRGGRVYFFTSSFSAADRKAREQVRKTVASVRW